MVTVSATTISGGNCGDDIFWSLDDSGKLSISGTGIFYDYNCWVSGKEVFCDSPWYEYKECIYSIEISTRSDIHW